MKISRQAAVLLILGTDGKIFAATARKRTTGELRTFRAMLARKVGVGKAGGELPYNPYERGLIPVYLMSGDENRCGEAAKNFRMINAEEITKVTVAGVEYEVE